MKYLKKYKKLVDKHTEYTLKLEAPMLLEKDKVVKQLKEITNELDTYKLAFRLFTEKENEIIKLRYHNNLNITTICNLMYISKSTYYERINSMELKISSFLEGMAQSSIQEKI